MRPFVSGLPFPSHQEANTTAGMFLQIPSGPHRDEQHNFPLSRRIEKQLASCPTNAGDWALPMSF